MFNDAVGLLARFHDAVIIYCWSCESLPPRSFRVSLILELFESSVLFIHSALNHVSTHINETGHSHQQDQKLDQFLNVNGRALRRRSDSGLTLEDSNDD